MRRALLVILLLTAVPAFAGYDLEELTSRYDGILNATFGPFSVRDGAVLRASSRALPPEVLAERAGRQMEALADLHRADDIVAIVDALPPVARHHLASSVWLLAGASAIVADKPVRAREFLLHVKPDKDLKASLDLVRSLLTPGLADHDAFEVLAHFLGVTDGIWCDAFVLLAVRSGYNRIADTKRALAAATGPAGTAADEVLPTLPGDLAAELRACLWHERARWRPVVATSTGPLAADRIVPRLEEAAATVEREAVALSAEAVAEVKVPLAWQAVRLEQRGDVSTGLALSEVLDPVEDTAGAFWLLRSSDGGKSWEPPLYTGIRDSSPDAAEIAGRYLRMPWDSLRRDSDGDGVPDLVEERLGTDPQSVDSDGDGIPDSADMMPNVTNIGAATPESEALAHVIDAEHMSDPNEQTLFLIGEPSDFAPLHLSRRTVVLTPEDFAAYEDKFGPTLALDMTNMIVRHDGLVARVKLTWPLASRTYEVLKTVDGWRTFLVSSSAF